MKELHFVYIGIDVSKVSLSIDAGDHYRGEIRNSATDIRRLVKELKRKIGRNSVPQFCFESTGPYGDTLFAECCKAGVPASVLNPSKVRHYAKAMSQTAKTDPIDARVIRLFAEARRPEPTREPGRAESTLRQLVLARDALTKSVVQLSGALDSVHEAPARRPLSQAVDGLKKKIQRIDGQIALIRKEDHRLDGLVGVLSQITGVGELSASKIVALVPELGTLGRRDSASLAGLAPFARDSGRLKGKAFVCGGRAAVRRALFMPATVAVKHNPVLKSAFEKLRQRGKPYKVALTAIMRKLFFYMDRVAAQWYAEHDGVTGAATAQHAPA